MTEMTLSTLEAITIDRRSGKERRQLDNSKTVNCERRKSTRRRQIDPTTCEREYSPDEIEFMQAMDSYKRTSGRMFPTCSEVLEVLKSLGYFKLTPTGLASPTILPAVEATAPACV